jgi:hypothetical protein
MKEKNKRESLGRLLLDFGPDVVGDWGRIFSSRHEFLREYRLLACDDWG